MTTAMHQRLTGSSTGMRSGLAARTCSSGKVCIACSIGCVERSLLPAPCRYQAMRDALNKTGRPILYSLCEWGVADPWLWAPEVGGWAGLMPPIQHCCWAVCMALARECRAAAPYFRLHISMLPYLQIGNSWRTTQDVSANWESILSVLDNTIGLARYAGPGHWNDPDMLGASLLVLGAAMALHNYFCLTAGSRQLDPAAQPSAGMHVACAGPWQPAPPFSIAEHQAQLPSAPLAYAQRWATAT